MIHDRRNECRPRNRRGSIVLAFRGLLLALVCCLSQLALAAPCPTGYGYYKRITYASSTWGLGADVSGFPIVITGGSAAADTSHGGNSQSAGFDIVPCDALTGGNLLAHERANYVNTDGTVEIHAVITVTHSVDTNIWVFIGKASDSDHSCGATSSCGTTVWPSFLGVYHGGTSSSLVLTDSTGNHNATANSFVLAGAGKLNGAFQMNSSSNAGSLALNGNEYASAVTVEMWMYAPVFGSTGTKGSCGNYISGGNGYAVIANANTTTTFGYALYSQTANFNTTWYYSPTTISTQAWHHLVAVYNGGTLNSSSSWAVYVDGVSQTLTAGGTGSSGWQTPGTTMSCGYLGNGTTNEYIDELRYYSGSYTSDLVKVQYNSQSSPQSIGGSLTPTQHASQPFVAIISELSNETDVFRFTTPVLKGLNR